MVWIHYFPTVAKLARRKKSMKSSNGTQLKMAERWRDELKSSAAPPLLNVPMYFCVIFGDLRARSYKTFSKEEFNN